ncbi:MAG TPA: hypothetical protein VMG08_14200 [Allosphingosinicella sp.]|nr:hypothetical protein [Allosphingosinicella sp.]
MPLFGLAAVSMLLLAAPGGRVANVPGDIPYSCGEGHVARITYENGGWFVRAKAKLVWDGRTVQLQASPPTYGLRYVSADDAADPILVWTARGEEAWITEIARSDAADTPEREVARCTRVREGGAEPAAGAPHAEGDDSH